MVTVVIIIGIPSAYIRRSFWSPLRVMPSFIVLLYKAQIPLRRFCDKVWDKFPTKSQTCRGHKSWKSATQITSPTFMICVADFHDLCSPTLSPTFPVHCNGLNSIRATQTGLSRTLSQTSQHVEMVCVHDFPRGEVSVKVGVMEFGF